MDKKHTLISAVSLCFKYAPGAATLYVLLSVMGGLLPPFMVVIVANFIDSALTMASGTPSIVPLLFSAALMLIGYSYNQLSQVFQRLSTKSIETGLRYNLRPLLVNKQASLDFELAEQPKTLDLITFVCQDTESRLIAILSDFTTSLRLILQITGIMMILISYIWWLLPVFLFGAIPLVIVSHRGGAALAKKEKEITVLTRMMYYLSDVLTGREAAAERTLFGFSQGINEKFKAIHLKRSNMNTELLARFMIRSNACGIALNLFVLIAMLSLAQQVSGGNMTSGGYIAIVGAMINLSRVLSGAVSDLVFGISEHTGYMKAFTEFWALSSDESVLTYTPLKMTFVRLEIKDLWFKYKDAEEYVLKGLNLSIEKDTSYSLIGQNGAGKTTLTKILTGLYRDFEGEITINSKDIRAYTTNELRSLFSIIYQDYAKYYISLKDNITFGGAQEGFDKVIQNTELHTVTQKLPLGVNTPLGKILEDGADVSGGEWQKIAIARAVFKDCPFIILDEPTASLSPMMESKIYNQFSKVSEGRTQLLISHRLGSTKLSDTLLVLADGKIAEIGSHNDLMRTGGLYAQMFESQRSWYDENE